MNEKRRQQIIDDKNAQEKLRAMGVEISPCERRTLSQILNKMSQRALKETVKTDHDEV